MNNLWEFPGQYAYLWTSLGLLVSALLFYIFVSSQRRLMLISGLLSTPFALTSYFFVPEYWQPDRMVVFITGVEDLIFSFSNGVILIGLISRKLPFSIRNSKVCKVSLNRLMGCLSACVLPWLFLLCAGVRTMEATLIVGFIFWALYLWICKGRILAASVVGGISFCIFYLFFLKCAIFLFPQIPRWFSPTGIGSRMVSGIPLGELLWSLFFGATWPLFLGWIMGWHRTFDRDADEFQIPALSAFFKKMPHTAESDEF